MKYFKILTILLLTSVISFYGCNDKTDSTKKENPQSVEVPNSPTTTNTATATPATAEPEKNAGGVWHYTCSKGCAGGAGSAAKCNTCGNLLTHNQAYHSKTDTTTSSAPFATPETTAPAVEPSQNSAGVWHYTCGNGCAGGAGAAGACGTCSGTLTHNSAYH